MRCTRDRVSPLGGKWPGCLSPYACEDWGYCRNRNIDAGGMKNVTSEMQAEWRRLDNPTPGADQ